MHPKRCVVSRSKVSAAPQDLLSRRALSIQLSATYLTVTPCFIRHLIAAGEIPFVLAGKRFILDRLDLDHWLESQKVINPSTQNIGVETGKSNE